MGLIKAFSTSKSSVLGEQFKEYVTCPTMDKGVLVQRGIVEHGKRSEEHTSELQSHA